MKDSGEGTNGAGQLAKPNQRAAISQRKLKANRENARKSTGPKTPRATSPSSECAFHAMKSVLLFYLNCDGSRVIGRAWVRVWRFSPALLIERHQGGS